MENIFSKILIMLAGLILMSCSEEPSTITVDGNATVKVPVDYVKFTVGLSDRSDNLNELEKSSYETILKLKNLLIDEWQLPDSLVQTGRSSIDEQYNRNSQNPSYRFNQTMSVTLDSLELYDTLRRALIETGATQIEIQTFGTYNQNSSKQKALRKAYQNARNKAELLAQNADFSIGKPQKISSSGRFSIPEGQFEVTVRGNSTISLSSNLALESSIIKKFIEVKGDVDVIFTLQ